MVICILSDHNIVEGKLPIHILLAVGAVHNHLTRRVFVVMLT